jgi:hypothetical protein
MRVTLHIAIDETGRGAIALTREQAVSAVGDTPRIAVASFPCWDLSAAMARGGHLPIQFSLEKDSGASSGALRREVKSWSRA